MGLAIKLFGDFRNLQILIPLRSFFSERNDKTLPLTSFLLLMCHVPFKRTLYSPLRNRLHHEKPSKGSLRSNDPLLWPSGRHSVHFVVHLHSMKVTRFQAHTYPPVLARSLAYIDWRLLATLRQHPHSTFNNSHWEHSRSCWCYPHL